MPAPMPTYLPWLMTAGFGWMYYRRLRRHFGWQPWQPRRTLARIVILALVGFGFSLILREVRLTNRMVPRGE